jgi:hypothetical protein
MKTTLFALLGLTVLASATGCGLPSRGAPIMMVSPRDTLRDNEIVNSVKPLPAPLLRKADRE